jgi:hypothetical protein
MTQNRPSPSAISEPRLAQVAQMRYFGAAPEGPMTLSVQQIALMSRLLDEALPLDEADRRLWLVNLSPEYQDLAQALRAALLRRATVPMRFHAVTTRAAKKINRIHQGHSRYSRSPSM